MAHAAAQDTVNSSDLHKNSFARYMKHCQKGQQTAAPEKLRTHASTWRGRQPAADEQDSPKILEMEQIAEIAHTMEPAHPQVDTRSVK